MSYSFSVKAADKAEALSKIGAEFDQVIAAQAAHKKDREPALAVAAAYIDLIVADGRPMIVSMHGSLGWNSSDPEKINGSGVGVSVHLD